MRDLSAKEWRRKCGTVMQDGYIFSDTIATNIAVDGQRIDEARLMHAVRVANIQDYVKRLPLGFSTKIGNTGVGAQRRAAAAYLHCPGGVQRPALHLLRRSHQCAGRQQRTGDHEQP